MAPNGGLDDDEYAGLGFEAAVVPTVAAQMAAIEAEEPAPRDDCAPAARIEMPKPFSTTTRWEPHAKHSVFCGCGVCLGERLNGGPARQWKAEPGSRRERPGAKPRHDEPAQKPDLLSRLAVLEKQKLGHAPAARVRIRLVAGDVSQTCRAEDRPHPPGQPWGRRPFRMKRKTPDEVAYLQMANALEAALA